MMFASNAHICCFLVIAGHKCLIDKEQSFVFVNNTMQSNDRFHYLHCYLIYSWKRQEKPTNCGFKAKRNVLKT